MTTLPCSIWHSSRRYASVARSAVGSLCSRLNPLRVPVRRSSNRKRTTILTPNVVVAAYDHPRHDTHQNLGKHQLTMGIVKMHFLSSPMVVVGSTTTPVVVVVSIVSFT